MVLSVFLLFFGGVFGFCFWVWFWFWVWVCFCFWFGFVFGLVLFLVWFWVLFWVLFCFVLFLELYDSRCLDPNNEGEDRGRSLPNFVGDVKMLIIFPL